jgi:hypothetical protein
MGPQSQTETTAVDFAVINHHASDLQIQQYQTESRLQPTHQSEVSMSDVEPSPQQTQSAPDPNAMLLEQAYETIRGLYSLTTQWATLLSAAWALLTGLGFQKDSASAALVFIGGTMLLIIGYLTNRAGVAIGAAAISALLYEQKLGLPKGQSMTAGTLLGFRGMKYAKSMVTYAEARETFDWFTTGPKAASYNLFHLRRSKLTIGVTVGGVFQCALAIYLGLIGKLPWPY